MLHLETVLLAPYCCYCCCCHHFDMLSRPNCVLVVRENKNKNKTKLKQNLPEARDMLSLEPAPCCCCCNSRDVTMVDIVLSFGVCCGCGSR